MSYLQHRRHDPRHDTDGISFLDLHLPSSDTYRSVVDMKREADLGDERSSLRPIINRKSLHSPSLTLEPIIPVNGGS